MKTVNQLSSASPLSHVMLLAPQRHSGKILCACQVPKVMLVTSQRAGSLPPLRVLIGCLLSLQDSLALAASDWAVAVCRHLGGGAGGSSLVAKGTGSSGDIIEALRWAEDFARQRTER